MSRRQSVLGGVLIVALAATGYMLFGRSSAGPTIGERFSEAGVCLSCKAESDVTYPREEAAPHRCPKCGQQTFYPWYFCYDCKQRFVPTLEHRDPGGPLRIPLVPACPKCRGANVAPYLKGQPGFESTGDLPLPKLP